MTMPDMGGGEVLDQLRRMDPKVRVVLCSGYTEEDVAERIETAQVSAFLQKPYSASALVSAIELALKTRD
jgi:CheY-like chemotaxis protein